MRRSVLDNQLPKREQQLYDRAVAGGKTKAFILLVGLLPYVGGGFLVLLTRDVVVLAIAGILITGFCTTGAYLVRKRRDCQTAKYRAIADPFLYGFEFAFSAVLVRYVLIAHR